MAMLETLKSLVRTKNLFAEQARLILDDEENFDRVMFLEDGEDPVLPEGTKDPLQNDNTEVQPEGEQPMPIHTDSDAPSVDTSNTDNDIMSMEINTSTDTVSNVVPSPPANAGDQVETPDSPNGGDIMNEPIDSPVPTSEPSKDIMDAPIDSEPSPQEPSEDVMDEPIDGSDEDIAKDESGKPVLMTSERREALGHALSNTFGRSDEIKNKMSTKDFLNKYGDDEDEKNESFNFWDSGFDERGDIFDTDIDDFTEATSFEVITLAQKVIQKARAGRYEDFLIGKRRYHVDYAANGKHLNIECRKPRSADGNNLSMKIGGGASITNPKVEVTDGDPWGGNELPEAEAKRRLKFYLDNDWIAYGHESFDINDSFMEDISIGDDGSSSDSDDKAPDEDIGDEGKDNTVTAAVKEKVSDSEDESNTEPTEPSSTDESIMDEPFGSDDGSAGGGISNKEELVKKTASIIKSNVDLMSQIQAAN